LLPTTETHNNGENMTESKKIAMFIKKHGVACGGNWTAMLMYTIKNGLPKIYKAMDDDKEYSYEELYKILAENI
jgi:hypothetical protein